MGNPQVEESRSPLTHCPECGRRCTIWGNKAIAIFLYVCRGCGARYRAQAPKKLQSAYFVALVTGGLASALSMLVLSEGIWLGFVLIVLLLGGGTWVEARFARWLHRQPFWHRDARVSRRCEVLIRKLGFTFSIVVFGGAFLAILFGAAWMTLAVTPGDISARLAEIEAGSHPLSTEALVEYGTVPGKQSTAALLEPASSALQQCMATPDGDEGLDPTENGAEAGGDGSNPRDLKKIWKDIRKCEPNSPLPSELRDEAQKLLARCEEVFPLLPALSALRESSISLSISSEHVLDAGDTRTFARLSELIALRAFLSSPEAGVNEMKEILLYLSALRDTHAQVPEILAMMFQLSVLRDQTVLLEQLLPRVSTPQELAELQAALSRVDTKSLLERALAGDRCAMYADYSADAQALLSLEDRAFSPRGGWLRAKRMKLLHAYDFELSHADADWSDLYRHEESISEADLKWYDVALEPIQLIGAKKFAAGCRSGATLEALQRVINAAFLLEWHRLSEGTTAGNLEAIPNALSATWPRDPFDDQPLRFESTEDGYRVYSVGAKRPDDPGVPYLETPINESDLAIRIVRSPPMSN